MGLKKLILELVDSFRDRVDPQKPAKLTPFKIKLDKAQGAPSFPKAMKLGPRRQCDEHNQEIAKQVGTLTGREVIETNEAEYYSQVVLARKANMTWRFCVDFRHLNAITQGFSFPLPNIKQLQQKYNTSIQLSLRTSCERHQAR